MFNNNFHNPFRVKTIFFVTNDRFLYAGLKSIIPNVELVHVKESYHTEAIELIIRKVQDLKYAVIFDNRITLKSFNRLMGEYFKSSHCISSLIMDMKGKSCVTLFTGYPPKIDAKTPSGVLLQIMDCISSGEHISLDNVKYRYEISRKEFEIIMAMLIGDHFEDLSRKLYVNKKTLYHHRGRMHLRFGFSSFNEVCLFIFRNKILQDPVMSRFRTIQRTHVYQAIDFLKFNDQC